MGRRWSCSSISARASPPRDLRDVLAVKVARQRTLGIVRADREIGRRRFLYAGSSLSKFPRAPCRHWVKLAERGNGPMVAGFATRPSVPDRTSRAAPRIDHQLRAGGSAPQRRCSGGPLLGSAQSFLDALSTSSANRSHRAITSERYCLSLGVVASAWSRRARAAASR
jgi:hypothetical protein